MSNGLKPSVSYNNGVITVVTHGNGGVPVQVRPSSPYYKSVENWLKKKGSEAEFLAIFEPKAEAVKPAPKQFAGANGVKVQNGVVTYNGEAVHSLVARRITEFVEKGYPIQPLVNFLNKVMQNPSMVAQQELYDFLANKDLPITDDGDFIAYKAVREDWRDIYSGTIDNSVGAVVEMPRARVDDNRKVHCSKGLHCGAMDYVTQYGGRDSRIVLVKVNPADAVSVPDDHSFMKLRVCKYVVVQEYEGDLKKLLYANDATQHPEVDEDEVENQDWLDEAFEEDDEDEDIENDVTSRYFDHRRAAGSFFEWDVQAGRGYWLDSQGKREGESGLSLRSVINNTTEVTREEMDKALGLHKCCVGKGCGKHNVRDASGRFTKK